MDVRNQDPDPLIGLRVQVSIDEDGDPTPRPGLLLPGTITRKLPGGGPCYVVHLDKPFRYVRPLRGKDEVLTEVSIQSRFKGHPLELLLSRTVPASSSDGLTVNITNLSTKEYFAIGGVRRVE
jgi:hypothetical protein